jgi:methanethiol S-methyltransferase
VARRIAIFGFGVASYAVFLAVFLYTLGFVSNALVPKSVDSGADPGAGPALASNLALLALFALQHSVMARPAFKRAWTRVVLVEAERSAYVLASSTALALLYAGWQPMPALVLSLDGDPARAAAWTLCGLGALLVLYATFLIGHLDLFGLRPAWLALRR